MSFEAELKNTYARAHQRLLNPKPPTPPIPAPKLVVVPKIPAKRQTVRPDQRQLVLDDFRILPIVRTPKLKHILYTVSEAWGLDPRDVASERRRRVFVEARQVYCFLAYHYTQYSLGQLGRSLGGKDHTTVLHAVRKFERLVAESEIWRNKVHDIMKVLKIDIEIKGVG